jgi:hypothetical protein
MLTELSAADEVNIEHLRRLMEQLEAMGARISILAQALGLPLHTAADAMAALSCGDTSAKSGKGRQAAMREELRGLLVLRYDLVMQLALDPNIGAAAAREILLCANEKLRSKGFPAGAPGMDLGAMFDGLQR